MLSGYGNTDATTVMAISFSWVSRVPWIFAFAAVVGMR